MGPRRSLCCSSQPAWDQHLGAGDVHKWTHGLKLLVPSLSYLETLRQAPLPPTQKLASMNGRLASDAGKYDQTVVQMGQGGSSSSGGGNGSKYR